MRKKGVPFGRSHSSEPFLLCATDFALNAVFMKVLEQNICLPADPARSVCKQNVSVISRLAASPALRILLPLFVHRISAWV